MSSERDAPRQPTDAELEILHVLWEAPDATVRQVHTALAAKRRVGYTTTLKLMQIMHGKGLVYRNARVWPHRFRANLGREATEVRMLRDFAQKVFLGSANQLVLRALEETDLSDADRQAVEEIINAMDRET